MTAQDRAMNAVKSFATDSYSSFNYLLLQLLVDASNDQSSSQYPCRL